MAESFESMKLRPDILRGLFSHGYERPSPIQVKALPAMLSGRDVIAQAQSGTGKTSMSAMAALQLSNPSKNELQVLILSPNRELAIQTNDCIQLIGEFTSIRSISLVGGKAIQQDIKSVGGGGSGGAFGSKGSSHSVKGSMSISSNVHIISGTPGRVLDMIKRGAVSCRKIRMLIVDEADEMLSRGFKEQLYDIYKHLPAEVQVVLVSATLDKEVLALTEQFMTDPVKILVRREQVTLEGIRQFYIDVEKEEWKLDTLCDLYETLTIAQCVVFVNTRKKCEFVAKKMKENLFTVSLMHGDMTQREREDVMNEFRSGKSRILVATDVWSRGIDVQQVSLVVNYDVPRARENYVHRIGRSGRFGRKGVAITFVIEEDKECLKDLERFYKIKIEEMPAGIADML